MRAPENITIKLDISVPTGGGCPGDSYRFSTERTPEQRWNSVANPYSGSAYSDGCDICVEPLSNTNLGAVSLQFYYSSSKTNVMAIVYPIYLAHDDANPPMSGTSYVATAGTSTDGGHTWKWYNTNKLRGADYCATPQTRENKVCLWTSTNNGANWVPDTPLRFYGVTGGSCGSNAMAPEPAKQPELIVEIPGGKGKPRSLHAKPTQCGVWEFSLDGHLCSIHLHANTVFLTNGKDVVLALKHGLNPLSALFPARVLGVDGEIRVYEAS